MGVSYNSYLILDEKIAVMDSVDARAADEWLAKLAHELDRRSPTTSLSRTWSRILRQHPAPCGEISEMKLVGNTKTFTMLRQFFGAKAPTDDRLLEVGEVKRSPRRAYASFMLAPMVTGPGDGRLRGNREAPLLRRRLRALRLAGAPPTRRGHRRHGATTTTSSASTARRCRRC